MNICYGIDVEAKRLALVKSRVFSRKMTEIIQAAEVAVSAPCPELKMSEYMMYFENGNRNVFERSYFERRRNCYNLFVACWLTGEEKYLASLCDYIGCICDEFTWCLPAHVHMFGQGISDSLGSIDLFQAETGRLFAEIVMCIGDKLPEYIMERMSVEIDRRIIAPLETGRSWYWQECRNNWAAVCGAGCLAAVLCFGTCELKDKYAEKLTVCADSYLASVPEDGCCLEGVAYWNYGFGNFVVLAQMIREYTRGKRDYFALQKVRNLALYLQRIRLSDSGVPSISDGGDNFVYRIGVMSFLKRIYPDLSMPDINYGTINCKISSVFDILWFDENYTSDMGDVGCHYFKEGKWYVNRKSLYGFAAKGGHNGEPHNHNDIGAFMIRTGNETFVSDPGCGEYVRDTFYPETRYGFVQNCSRGHSLPIVNDCYQLPGKEYCSGNEVAGEDSFSLEIQGAYPKGLIDRITRSFELLEDRVILRDSFEFSEETKFIKDRIVSKRRPLMTEGVADFGVGRIYYDKDRYRVSLTSESYTAHNGKDNIEIYMLDFEPADAMDREVILEFRIFQ